MKTLEMPSTAKAFIIFRMMATMLILAAVVAHVVVGIGVNNGDVSLLDSEQRALWLEAARRFGVSIYLFGLGLGLATIIQVLRFQGFRIRENASARS